MKKIFASLLLLFPLVSACAQPVQFDEARLRKEAAQMLIIGFRGTTLTPKNPIYNNIKQSEIGGVILFEYDTPSKSRPRNIESSKQLAKLNADLQALSKEKLFISIDQEGGMVNRLKQQYGFPAFVSAAYLGNLDNEDSTRFWAAKTSYILTEAGFNVNFAPCVDLNINPQCPVIGKIDRSFSNNPEKVAKHAAIWVEEQRKKKIYSALKHFPGHGSSSTDTHLQFTDVTSSWQPIELDPYRVLIAEGDCDFIMTSHIMNRKLDSINPATLSYNILSGILRTELGFKGLIISDDMDMGAIRQNYTLEQALEKGINAGVNMFIFSNNGKTYNPKLVEDILDTIVGLVKARKVSSEKISDSYKLIMQYKQ